MPPLPPQRPLSLDQTVQLTRLYERLLLAAFSMSPVVGLLYLWHFQSPTLLFEHHGFHEVAIALAIATSAFVCFVTVRCYNSSGEPLLRWMALGLLGFTVVYAPHGLLTRLAGHHLDIFLLYGPVSRVVLAACLLRALTVYRQPVEPATVRARRGYWLRWTMLFIALDLAVAALALLGDHMVPPPRLVFEIAALLLAACSLIVLLRHRTGSPLMLIAAIAVVMFAESSAAFILSRAWNHTWWFAHAIFALGFFLLSFGIVRAFQSTRAFSTMPSQEELMRELYVEKERAQAALSQLQRAHADLERLAATDSLTGASNRRHFMASLATEWARAQRSGHPLGLLALDIDHFKRINDHHGHAAGDKALAGFVATASAVLRPGDVIGRIGGEEFAVLLPQAGPDVAATVAERIRAAIEGLRLPMETGELRLTVSIGVAAAHTDGLNPEGLLRAADRQLYRAKHEGRNRVQAATATDAQTPVDSGPA